MAIKSLKSIPIYAWIPPTYDALYKIVANSIDITDLILSGEITDGATDTIGNFNFTIDNSDENYTNAFSVGDILNYYCDYDLTATTQTFKGIIEKVSAINNTIKISGRTPGSILLTTNVTKAYDNIETSIILKDLINSYSTFTTTNVETSTKSVTKNWYQKPLWECIQELCYETNFDCYVDVNGDINYFELRNNSTDVAVHDANIVDIADFAYDGSDTVNSVTVKGSDIGGFPLIATAGSGTPEKIINDSSITTYNQASERAIYELALAKDPPLVGEITVIGLASILPGQRLRISAPDSGINPDYYKIISFKHKFGDLFQTILTVNKEPKKIYHVVKSLISNQGSLKDNPNPNEMKYTWNFDFETDSGIHSNTQITNGFLLPTASSGTWISETRNLTSNATFAEIRATGTSITNGTFYISSDGGINWQTVTTLTSPVAITPGSSLKIKIGLITGVEIDSVVVLYK